MRARSTLLAGAGALVLAAVVWSGQRSPAAPPAPPPAPPGDVLAALRAEIAQLRAAVRKAEALVAAAPPAAPDAVASAAPPADPPNRTDDARLDEEAQVADIVDRLGRALAAEGTDAAWAKATEAAILETLADPGNAGLTLARTTCGTTLCRVELDSQLDRATVEELVARLTRFEPFRHGGFADLSDAEHRLSMFIARADHELPSIASR